MRIVDNVDVNQRWAPGQVVVRREVLGFEHRERNTGIERVWFGYPVHVVSEDNEQLVTYVGPAAEFGFVPGEWPTESGSHPLGGPAGAVTAA